MELPQRIFLIGFMGAGKSTLGKKLAKLLDRPFIDLDKEVERKAQCSISDIFKYLGEEEFRLMESSCLQTLGIEERFVMATGGGTPCYHSNMNFILQNGYSIYLNMDEKSIFKRLVNAKNIRPSIKGKSNEELEQFIHQKYQERKSIYEQAALHLPALSLQASDILKALQVEFSSGN